MRLYPQTPDVVIVWVAGTVDGHTVQMLALRLSQQLMRVGHVIVDLSAAVIPPACQLVVADVLQLIAQQPRGVRSQLHIAGLAQENFARRLRNRGVGHVHVEPSAAVIAALISPARPTQRY